MGKYLLPFEILIFRNIELVRDDNRFMFVWMTSTQEQRVAFASSPELCPSNHFTGHKL